MAARKTIAQIPLTVLVALLGACGVAVVISLLARGGTGKPPIEIEWYASYYESYFPRWIEEFEKAHADQNVRVKFKAMVTGEPQKVYTMLISHSLCDVIAASPILLENDAFEPLTLEQIDASDQIPIAIKLATDGKGRIIGFPSGSDIRGFVYYNNADLKEAGTTADAAPETFDAYSRWASQMFKWDVGGRTVWGMPKAEDVARARMLRRPIGMTRGFFFSSLSFLLAYVEPLPDANGISDHSLDDYLGGPRSNRPFRFDTPEVIAGLREYQKFFLPRDRAVADGDTSRMGAFKNGIYSGIEGANWVYGEVFTIDLAVTKYPHAQGKKMRTWMNAGVIGIARESKHKELATEFVKFITSTDCQADAYYGHGYLPSRYSAWRQLAEDAKMDDAIRAQFLAPLAGDRRFVGVPQIKRKSHDALEITLYVPGALDAELARIPDGVPASAELGQLAQRLCKDVGAFASRATTLTIQSTPPEMIPSRSFVPKSPIPVYEPLLADCGVWVPLDQIWLRLEGEVITRMLERVTRASNPDTPEAAAKWAQAEAEDISAGRK